MKIEINNHSNLKYEKLEEVVSTCTRASLINDVQKGPWKLKVWFDEGQTRDSTKESTEVECGIALMRPHKSTLYTKSSASNLLDVVKNNLNTIEKSIRREGQNWSRTTPSFQE